MNVHRLKSCKESICPKKISKTILNMTQITENLDSKQTDEIHECDIENRVESNAELYPKLETMVVPPTKNITIQLNATQRQQQQPQHQQQTTFNNQRNGHSRNPSSINGISIAAQVIQPPPPNKPDAIQNLLKLIRYRSNEKTENRQICGIREARPIMMFILIVVFLISGTVFFVMWFTEYYNDSIVSVSSDQLLAENSTAYEYFKKPPLNPQLRVHVFNYTNTERFFGGLDKKLIVKDIGPYVYTEKAEKVNVVYNDNNTISYKEYRSFDFRTDISAGKPYDQVIVPNVPYMTAAWQLASADFVHAFGINTAIMATNSKPFVSLPVHSFLWGYDDALVEQSKLFSLNPPKFDKFGMLTTRNGTSVESFTINSGVDDIKKLNVIDNFNGEPRMKFWSTNECNRVDGTDDSQFPPHLMDKTHTLQVFIKAFCRKFPMVFDSEVSLFNGVPAWRYKAPRNVFDSPDTNPENACYCDLGSGRCPPSGIFNATLCFDAPIFSSFPHFLYGDPKLFENIEGLSPNEEDHLTFADIHPRLAFPMAGSSRFQINVQVHKTRSELNLFQPEQTLPIMWMEMTSSEVPEELRAMIYHSTLSANAVQLILRYGSVFGLAVSITMLVAGCYLKNTEGDQIARSKGIKAIKEPGKVNIEELVTIELNELTKPYTDSNYVVKE